ncbi:MULTISPECIES: class F sortase [unclassified Streptomyces]|uniref:class F sortase n=1 Tax=unclassified Streptomyces TaxID=2593676 RepID=UPI002258BBE4|nr:MULTISPECIES: class F sortase [unclassified Streptomyces]MCX5053459.1 class F sortase [Streptomyces sp. NBC_00474]MCX5059273.1 class F sortase [Streptomyces sp. NBC_00452]MCX5244082.1 class F sortase [Streptomyces sp. NBC_00201]MCX5290185.1 class F sortase [Streptomyces sp. NBC_00183]
MAAPPSPTGDEPVPTGQGSSRSGAMMMCAAAGLLLAASLISGQGESTDESSPPGGPQSAATAPQAADSLPRSAVSAPPAGQPAGKHLPRSRPVRLRIPKIWVDAPFTDLYIGSTGQLEPPPAADTNLVGWHVKGASPGEAGTAIIAGHVDTKTSAAVFANLGELRKGDRFSVLRADGRTANFRVDGVETFDKSNFPSDRVYADTPQAQVRLITCAGDYDRSVRDYTDNLVVFAHLV